MSNSSIVFFFAVASALTMTAHNIAAAGAFTALACAGLASMLSFRAAERLFEVFLWCVGAQIASVMIFNTAQRSALTPWVIGVIVLSALMYFGAVATSSLKASTPSKPSVRRRTQIASELERMDSAAPEWGQDSGDDFDLLGGQDR